MTITQETQRRAEEDLQARVARLKKEFVDKIHRIQNMVSPPLSNVELSVGMELDPAPAGQVTRSRIGRIVSESRRNRNVLPIRLTRALINRLIDGKTLLAVQEPIMPGARREVMLCEPREVERLGADWRVFNVSGGPVPERSVASEDIDWDDDDLWSGGAVEAKRKTSRSSRSTGRSPGRKDTSRADLARTDPEPKEFPSVRWTPPRLDHGALEPLPLGRTGVMVSRLGLGCMRLSTEGRPEREQAIAVIHRALDAGVTLLDTADVYCTSEEDRGHNEALIAEALASWPGHAEPGDAKSVLVATKAGLTRPGGRWIPDGSPARLRAACEQSLAALGIDQLGLFQLHAVDSRVPFEESVAELEALQTDGLVAHLGLCNVSLEQLRQAREQIDVASVQVRLNPFDKSSFTKGLVRYCVENRIALIAYAPVGGHRGVGRVARDPLLKELGAKHDASPHQVALAWLMGLAPQITPIFGATRLESVTDSVGALELVLDEADLDALDQRFSFTASTRSAASQYLGGELAGETSDGPQREVVLFVGTPAAGKSSQVAPFLEQGYERLNRDEVGGSLDDLLPRLDEILAEEGASAVMDNTYGTRKQRRGVLEVASRHNVPVRCIWLETPLEDALVNASKRLLDQHGRLLDPDELKAASRKNPNTFPPFVIYRFARIFEEPSLAEGFHAIERVPFKRRIPDSHTTRAAIFDMDGTLRITKSGAPYPSSPEDVEILPGRREKLARLAEEGFTLLGISNQSGVAAGRVTEEQVQACFERTRELLGVDIDIRYCPHPSGAPVCWCRKPMPGLGVQLIQEYHVDRDASVFVGDMESDRECARMLGIDYQDAMTFFAAEP